MSLPEDLIYHALQLYEGTDYRSSAEVRNRSAVSSAYYSLFHKINEDAVATIAPHVQTSTNHRIQRWFDHSEMKKVCGRFITQPNLSQSLIGLIGNSASPDLQTVARNFVQLQEARHSVDYDLGYILDRTETRRFIELATEALRAWERIRDSAETNIFILSLLLWKNWDRERT
ncbi:MAG: hypothetical protein M3Y50_13485 [Acidobacteriota bacterium]|nr:hypothetical protein [Acidobacteriota bacterium]